MDDIYIESRTLCGSTKRPNKVESGVLTSPDSVTESNKLLKFVIRCNKYMRDDNLVESDPDQPSCKWVGGVFEYTGYQKMNRYMVQNLRDLGANIKLYSFIKKIDISVKEAFELAWDGHCDVPENSPVIYGAVQSTHKDEYVTHYMMNETQSLSSEDFIEGIRQNNEIWVPSNWNKNLLENLDLDVEIKVMPLGVDEKIYKPVKERVKYTSGTNEFVFLAISSWGWRKGWDCLIKAFCKAFSGNKNVSLVIHTLDGTDIYDSDIKHLVADIVGVDPPHIVHSNALIPEEVMPAVYCSADVFSLLSRGEGWGLPYSEAAACRIPIIGSYTTGQMEYLDHKYSYLVTPDTWVRPHYSMSRLSSIYDDSIFSGFTEGALDVAASKMRYVYNNYDEAKRKAIEFGDIFVERYSWKKSAERVYNRIVELNKITETQ